LSRLRTHLAALGVPLYPISAASGAGVPALLEAIWREVAAARDAERAEPSDTAASLDPRSA
jgi:hypothetical protein